VLASSEVARLVNRVKEGESDAFSSLVAAHLRAAYVTALAVVGRPGDAEDVVQEAFLAAFEHIESCREPRRFPGWLLRIVRNRALNYLAARRVRDVVGIDADRAADRHSDQPADVGLRTQLLDALNVLTPTQREIVLLHDLEGWTHNEIADVLNLSELMCRQHLFTARRTLRARLAQIGSMEFKNGN
jgi:RNA polymerase sigma-70 factor, ECF subfamily